MFSTFSRVQLSFFLSISENITSAYKQSGQPLDSASLLSCNIVECWFWLTAYRHISHSAYFCIHLSIYTFLPNSLSSSRDTHIWEDLEAFKLYCFMLVDPSALTLIKKKLKFSSYVRKFRIKQLQSHKWLTVSSYMGKYLRIYAYIGKPFLIYNFATASLSITIYMRKIWFSFFISALSPFHFPINSIPSSHTLSGLLHLTHGSLPNI